MCQKMSPLMNELLQFISDTKFSEWNVRETISGWQFATNCAFLSDDRNLPEKDLLPEAKKDFYAAANWMAC